VADWQNRSAALAEALRARRVTIRSIRPGAISITAHHGDALATPIGLRRPTTQTMVNSAGVGVRATETGRWWHLPVLGKHILVAGATGSGKGSVLWSIIAGLAPGVRVGWVRLLVIDPKGGMEFGRGQTLFTGFAHDNGEHWAYCDVTAVMQRAAALRGRDPPAPPEPLIILIVDEVASLTAISGRKLRASRTTSGCAALPGRAVSVSSHVTMQIRQRRSCPSAVVLIR
jgi:S-DNA-T family DNA segregation ATPase FtsK/SpoIIIE